MSRRADLEGRSPDWPPRHFPGGGIVGTVGPGGTAGAVGVSSTCGSGNTGDSGGLSLGSGIDGSGNPNPTDPVGSGGGAIDGTAGFASGWGIGGTVSVGVGGASVSTGRAFGFASGGSAVCG
jgi:hypothetical protein